MAKQPKRITRPVVPVRQWLDVWKEVKFDPRRRQAKPEQEFFLFSLPAAELKSLTGIYRRTARRNVPRATDPNVQRAHDEDRSRAIRDFVQYGFPWCELSASKRKMPEFQNLRKPGWLPTAIVVNIIRPGEMREGKKLSSDDAVTVSQGPSGTELQLPAGFSGPSWRHSSVPPMEVIDGQHRLWAFEDYSPEGAFDLPVVAFHGLDRSWQAYLFWSINITPKRIKQSLAFDLYPLLRTEDWLERFHGHPIYRETRAQELTESLWSHPSSPWYQRINMLGESGAKVPMVSQAAWIRSLMNTFVKTWDDDSQRIGGLFGAPRSEHIGVLPWNRAQQAAFLIRFGNAVRDAIKDSKWPWARVIRQDSQAALFAKEDDPAFYGQYSLLSTDQGVRGLLSVANDICFVLSEDLKLDDWQGDPEGAATDEDQVSKELRTLQRQEVSSLLDEIADALADYDWRTSAEPHLTETERMRQAVYRGSSGYKELRRHLLKHIAAKRGRVATAAQHVITVLGY